MSILAKKDISLFLNLSASPFTLGKMKSGTACWAMPFPNSTSP